MKKKIKHFFSSFFTNDLSPKSNRKIIGGLLIALSFVLFFLFVLRLFYIQLTGTVAQVDLEEKTKKLYHGSTVITAKRGEILDQKGQTIAKDAFSYSVYAILDKNYIGLNNTHLYAKEKEFKKLAAILHKELGIDETFALTQLNTKTKEGKTPFQVEFGNKGENLSLAKKTKIEEILKKENLTGLFFLEHPTRLYPDGDFASYLIGYAKKKNEEEGTQQLEGMMGIEALYNKLLKGKNGYITYQKDHNARPVPGTVEKKQKAVDGKNIYTTINGQLQDYLEMLMDKSYKQYKPENLTAVLMNAKTGEILSMSQRPSFNPQKGFEKDSIYRNIPIEDAFEPGSTMKTMLLAAAINEGKFDPEQYYDNTKLNIYDATIFDHDFGRIGGLNMSQAYSWSSNIGMVLLEEKLGQSKWQEYLKKFGFGQTTHSGFSQETKGLLPEKNKVSIAMSSFGQAISVSQMQMLQAYTAITNHGKMLRPYFISAIEDPKTGKIDKKLPQELNKIITDETATQVLEHMATVVEDQKYGTGTSYAIDGYRIGAKTGTAQIAENGQYITGENNYIFSAMLAAPIEDPQYLLYATVKKPKKFEKQTLAELTSPFLKQALDMMNTQEPEHSVKIKDYTKLSTNEAVATLQQQNLIPVVIGKGTKIEKQMIPKGRRLLTGSKVMIVTDGQKTMPNITNWSKTDLLTLEEILDTTFTFVGEGTGFTQSVPEGTVITEGDTIRIVLKK